MRGVGVGRVLASKSKLAAQGDLVTGFTGWTQYAVMTEGQFEPAPRDLQVRHPQDLLSALGHTGITAWWGMKEIGNPGPGETVVVSAAAGATGYVAGQIAMIMGARVVGICGSDDKCDWLVKELGFAAALNYKADDFETRLTEETPDFIDVYFDNGEMSSSRPIPLLQFQSRPDQRLTLYIKWQSPVASSTYAWGGPRSMPASLRAAS